MYVLLKIQNNNVPLRPILTMVNSAQHKLVKFLNDLDQLFSVLEHFSSYVLKISFSFNKEKKTTHVWLLLKAKVYIQTIYH